MDTLIGKLTDLTYEFFGVVLPGFFLLLFLTIWWLGVGVMVEDRTGGMLPAITLRQIGWFEEELSPTRRVELVILLVVLCYFLGQLLNWFSRSRDGKPQPEEPTSKNGAGKTSVQADNEASPKPSVKAGWLPFLLFRFPTPQMAFNQPLAQLFDEVSKRLSTSGGSLSWRQFYPVARALIAENMTNSLVQTYQHKYTLHRCVTAIAVVLFWLCTASLLFGLVVPGPSPNWLVLVVLTTTSLLLVRVFSRSYKYFWGLWGDTIVTEAYSLVCVRKNEDTFGTKK